MFHHVWDRVFSTLIYAKAILTTLELAAIGLEGAEIENNGKDSAMLE